MRVLLMFLVILILSAQVFPQQSEGSPGLGALSFLIGDWKGEGGGKPGQASAGGFSFASELQGKVLVRRNYAEYAATKDRPAFRHDDLMVIYQGPDGKGMRADYFDNEGHVIQYSVAVSADGRTVTFLTEPSPSSPGFKLIFNRLQDDSLDLEFDIAPPGKPDAFSKYTGGRAVRK
jgi:hypothetical protein